MLIYFWLRLYDNLYTACIINGGLKYFFKINRLIEPIEVFEVNVGILEMFLPY